MENPEEYVFDDLDRYKWCFTFCYSFLLPGACFTYTPNILGVYSVKDLVGNNCKRSVNMFWVVLQNVMDCQYRF